MSEKKISDREYLYLSASLKAREANMLTRDKLERMLSAGSFDDVSTAWTTTCRWRSPKLF